MQVYPVSTIAKLLNLTERRVQQLSKDGVIPRSIKGKYDLVAAVQGYAKYLQDIVTGRNLTIDTDQEKAKLLKAQAEKAELELAILKDKYIPADDVQFEWLNLVLAFRSHILNMPTKLATKLAVIQNTAEIQQILQDELYEALTQLSKYDSEKTQNSNDSCKKSNKQVSPAAETFGKPVGRSVSTVIKRIKLLSLEDGIRAELLTNER